MMIKTCRFVDCRTKQNAILKFKTFAWSDIEATLNSVRCATTHCHPPLPFFIHICTFLYEVIAYSHAY